MRARSSWATRSPCHASTRSFSTRTPLGPASCRRPSPRPGAGLRAPRRRRRRWRRAPGLRPRPLWRRGLRPGRRGLVGLGPWRRSPSRARWRPPSRGRCACPPGCDGETRQRGVHHEVERPVQGMLDEPQARCHVCSLAGRTSDYRSARLSSQPLRISDSPGWSGLTNQLQGTSKGSVPDSHVNVSERVGAPSMRAPSSCSRVSTWRTWRTPGVGVWTRSSGP